LALRAYQPHPFFGAGVLLAAAALYYLTARLPYWWEALRPGAEATVEWISDRGALALEEAHLRAPAVSALLLYLTAFAADVGYYYLIRGLFGPGAVDEGEELSLYFFVLSLALWLVNRRWKPEWGRQTLDVVALGLALYSAGASTPEAGRQAIFLSVYAAAALTTALWEGKPALAYIASTYAFFALVRALDHFDVAAAAWPFPFMALAAWAYGTGFLLRAYRSWREVWRHCGWGLGAGAPTVGLLLLAIQGDPDPVATSLYVTTTAAVGFLGLLLAADAWLYRRLDPTGIGATLAFLLALLMGIGHFRPDNVQAYTVPVALYLLGGTVFLGRARVLSDELKPLIPWLELTAAGVLLVPPASEFLASPGLMEVSLLLGEALAVLLLGVGARRRFLVLPGVGFIVVAALRQAFATGGGGLPPWAVLAIAGAVVLGVGFSLLLQFDLWLRWHRAMVAWWGQFD